MGLMEEQKKHFKPGHQVYFLYLWLDTPLNLATHWSFRDLPCLCKTGCAKQKTHSREGQGRRLKRYEIPQTGVTYAAIYHNISYHGVNVTYNYIVCVCDLSIPKPPGNQKKHMRRLANTCCQMFLFCNSNTATFFGAQDTCWSLAWDQPSIPGAAVGTEFIMDNMTIMKTYADWWCNSHG